MSDRVLPNVAYILLWFPKASETFIFREVMNLWRLGLRVNVYTLYGCRSNYLSEEMQSISGQINRLGLSMLKRLPGAMYYWVKNKPKTTFRLLYTVPFRRWRSLETAGEAFLALMAGFILARCFKKEGVNHIHAPWADGPATAAWVASQLTDIPYSFTGRAVDIYPPDGALEEKIRDCAFIRTNTNTNRIYMKQFVEAKAKPVYLTYNGYPLKSFQTAGVQMKPPYQILAVGRFARFKGFVTLLKAAGQLEKQGFDFHLTLVGEGWRRTYFKMLCWRLGITERVSFPGFVSHDVISQLYCRADLFVMSSEIHSSGERDGIPNVIMEAMLHRLPVIATNLSSIKEVVKHGISGLLISPGDPEALARAVIKMTSNRVEALNMARRGRKTILTRFDPQRNHRQVARLYEKAAALTVNGAIKTGTSKVKL